MKVLEVVFTRRQEGWSCEITFSFASCRQFTNECMTVSSAAYHWWIAAWWNARISAKVYVAAHGAKKGERKAMGWAE